MKDKPSLPEEEKSQRYRILRSTISYLKHVGSSHFGNTAYKNPATWIRLCGWISGLQLTCFGYGSSLQAKPKTLLPPSWQQIAAGKPLVSLPLCPHGFSIPWNSQIPVHFVVTSLKICKNNNFWPSKCNYDILLCYSSHGQMAPVKRVTN